MGTPSSLDLHPAAGARFVFERQDSVAASDAMSVPDSPRYAVSVYLASGRRLDAELSWGADGRPELCQRPDSGWEDPWAHDEALKLARVLRKTPRSRLVRWRG